MQSFFNFVKICTKDLTERKKLTLPTYILCTYSFRKPFLDTISATNILFKNIVKYVIGPLFMSTIL